MDTSRTDVETVRTVVATDKWIQLNVRTDARTIQTNVAINFEQMSESFEWMSKPFEWLVERFERFFFRRSDNDWLTSWNG